MSGSEHRLKVAILGLNFAPEPTGIAPYTARVAAGLSERGHDVSVITTHPHYPHWKLPEVAPWRSRDRHGDVAVTRVRHFVPPDPRAQVARALSELSFGIRVTTSRWRGPDVVICPSPALISTALALGRNTVRNHAAFGVIVQDLYSAGVSEAHGEDGVAARALGALERHVLRSADGVAVIHDRFKDRLVRALDVEDDRVSVIRNWTHIDPAPEFDRAEFRERLGWRPDEIVVLHSGAMGEKQGLSNVAEAARFADRDRAPVRFVLLGHGGQRAALEALGAGVSALQFLDPLPGNDYVKAMASADLLLVNEKPGVHEMAVPSKLTSYFSSGRPVLAAVEQGGITADEVRAARAGIVVEPGDPQALLAAARELGEDRHRSDELGARGPAYCQTQLSENVALDSYDRWVRELYERRRLRNRAR